MTDEMYVTYQICAAQDEARETVMILSHHGQDPGDDWRRYCKAMDAALARRFHKDVG